MAWNDSRQRRRGGYEAYAGSSVAPELIESQGLAEVAKLPGLMVDHERMARELALAEGKFREDKLQSDRESLEELRRLGLFGDGGSAQGTAGAPQEGGRPTVVSTSGDPRYVSDQGRGIDMRRPESYTAAEFAQDPNAIARGMELQKSYADLYALEQDRLAGAARVEEGRWTDADTTRALTQQLGWTPERAERAMKRPGKDVTGLPKSKWKGMGAYGRGLGAEAEKAAAQRGVVAEELRRLGIDIPEGEADAIAEQLGRWGMIPESPYEALPEGSRPSTYSQAVAIERSRPMATLLEGGWMGKEAMERLQRMRAYEQTLRARGDEAAAAELEEVRKVATEVEAREYEVFRKGMYSTVKDSVGRRWDDQKVNDFIATYWDNEDAAKAQHAKLAEIIKQRIAVSAAHRQITEDQKAKREMAKNRAKQYDSRANQRFNERLDHASAEVARQKEAYKLEEAAHFDRTDKTPEGDPMWRSENYTEAEKAEEDALFARGEALDAAEESIEEYRQWASKTREEQGEDFWKGLPALRAGLDERLQGTTIMFEGRRVDLLSFTRPDEWAEARETSVSRADHDANLKSLGGRVDPLEDLSSKVPARGSDRLGAKDRATVAGWAVKNGLFDDQAESEEYVGALSAEEQRKFAAEQSKSLSRREREKDVAKTKGKGRGSKRKGGGAIPDAPSGKRHWESAPAEYTSRAQKDAWADNWDKVVVQGQGGSATTWKRGNSTADHATIIDTYGNASD